MKCYFDPEKDAQGQCQECGRFANRYYSKIVEGKFICIACFYDNKPFYEVVVGLIEEGKSAEVCGKCDRPVWYDRTAYKTEIKMLISTLIYDEKSYIMQHYPQSFKSECKNNCYYCIDHEVNQQVHRNDFIAYIADFECIVCSEKWVIEKER